MGPPTTMFAASTVLLLASVAHAQHEGYSIAPPAIHSGVVAFRRDQYRQAYDSPQQQYAQGGQLQQGSYQVSGSVLPQQQYGQQQGGYAQQGGPQAYAQQPQLQQQPQYQQPPQQQFQFQPPPAPISPFLPQQQQQPHGQYVQAPQQQQYPGFGYQQQPPQQQQYAPPPPQFYPQQPQVSPAAPNPFYGQQQQQRQQQPGGYVQQQPQQFQPLPVAQQPQYQQQQYSQAAPPQLQQQPYAQQPLPAAPQYSAPPPPPPPQPPLILQRPAAVIAPPPVIQQLPVSIARPAPPPPLQLIQREPQSLPTAPPPPDRFTPRVADIRDPVSAIAATARPHVAQPVPFETVTVIAVDSHAEQVADNHNRAEAPRPQPKKLRHKKKRVKVLPTVVETASIAAPLVMVSAHRASHRVVTTTFPPSIAPPSVTRVQQRVHPSTLPPAPPPQIVTQPPRVHKPSNRPSKLVELTTAASAKTPNEVFLQCCRETGIDAKCHSRCNFDTLTKKVLTGMFLGTDPCPQKNGRNMLQCAAQNGDHTPCCMDRGVHTTAAKNKCLGFCVMTPGSSFQADISMLPCWAVLNDIKGCFKDAILDQ